MESCELISFSKLYLKKKVCNKMKSNIFGDISYQSRRELATEKKSGICIRFLTYLVSREGTRFNHSVVMFPIE